VTYNFDPDAWFERERAVLLARRDRGELDDGTLATALEQLEKRYDEMVNRLDNTYQVGAMDRDSL
jgi:hypothetical protein